MSGSRSAALKLYKNLLRYGDSLKHTDQEFFLTRIRSEFEQNRHLTEAAEIQRLIEVK